MGDAGTYGAAGDAMRLGSVQTNTAAKTFNNQTLLLKNPANTFTLTMRNPPITADADTRINQPYKYLIAREGSTIFVKNMQTQAIESSGSTSTPETVIQYALTNGNRAGIYLAPGSYTMSAGFTGLSMSQSECSLIVDPGAVLSVPNAYTGSFLSFDNVTNCHLIGGHWDEAGSSVKAWTAIDIVSDAGESNSGHTIEQMYIRHCGKAIRLKTDASGWINTNTFANIFIDTSVIGFSFEHTGTFTPATSGCNTNYFGNNCIQALTAVTTHGIKDVNGRRNMFLNQYVTDFTGAMVTMSITANGSNTQIIGGSATSLNFSDLSTTGSWIRDEYVGDTAPVRNYSGPSLLTSADSPYTVGSVSLIRVDATSGSVTLNLPTAVGKTGRKYQIKRTDYIASTNAVIITPSGSQTINGCAGWRLAPAQELEIISDGTDWQVLNHTPVMGQNYFMYKGTTPNRAYFAGQSGLTDSFLTSTTSPAQDTLWALPFIVPRVTKFDSIMFRLTTNSTAGSSRAGIYHDNGNCYPGALIFDTGAIDTTSGAGAAPVTKSTTITSTLQTLQPGLYWLAYEQNTATGQISVLPGAGGNMAILATSTGMGLSNGYGWSVSHTFGTLPDPYTAGATELNSTPSASVPIPRIGLRSV